MDGMDGIDGAFILGKQSIFPSIVLVASALSLDLLNLKNSSNANPIALYIP